MAEEAKLGTRTLQDVQFDRASRWLRNHTRRHLPPPRHINEKINAQRTFLAAEIRNFNARPI